VKFLLHNRFTVESREMSTSIYHDQQYWKLNRENEIRELQTESQLREVAELQSKPKINERSKHLAMQRRTNSVDISTQLYLDAERMRRVKAELAEAMIAAECIGTPAITRRAAELIRDDMDIGDRLYKAAKESQERKASLAKQMDSSKSAAAAPLGRGRSSSLPSSSSINPVVAGTTGARSARSSSVGADPGRSASRAEILYQQAREAQKRKQAAIEEAEKLARISAVPMLNAHSLSLAANMSESTLQRIYNKFMPSSTSNSNTNTNVNGISGTNTSTPANKSAIKTHRVPSSSSDEREATFRPRIDKTSSMIAEKRFSASGVAGLSPGERLFRAASERAERLEALKATLSNRLFDECTFQPNAEKFLAAAGIQPTASPSSIKSKSPSGKRSAQVATSPQPRVRVQLKAPASVGEEMYQRHVMWQKEKEKRLEIQRKQEKEKELKDCTFEPVIVGSSGGISSTSFSSSAAAGASSASSGVTAKNSIPPVNANAKNEYFMKESKDIVSGVDTFLTRQEKARKLKEEKNVPVPVGAKWTGKTTTPMEFNLHSKSSRSSFGGYHPQAEANEFPPQGTFSSYRRPSTGADSLASGRSVNNRDSLNSLSGSGWGKQGEEKQASVIRNAGKGAVQAQGYSQSKGGYQDYFNDNSFLPQPTHPDPTTALFPSTSSMPLPQNQQEKKQLEMHHLASAEGIRMRLKQLTESNNLYNPPAMTSTSGQQPQASYMRDPVSRHSLQQQAPQQQIPTKVSIPAFDYFHGTF
jgi:hypothetical protein